MSFSIPLSSGMYSYHRRCGIGLMELSTWPQVSHLPETPGRASQFSRAMDPRAAHACYRDGEPLAPRKVGNSLQSRNCWCPW